MTPTVSVLLPVHNAGAYLASAVQSIQHQTFSDFELLAHDDGSTDSSLAVLRHLESFDPIRVRVSHSGNRGLVPTLNELASRARGKYLARMDADDISRPDRFFKQVQFLNDNPDCVAVGSHYDMMTEEGLPIGTIEMPLHHDEIDSAHMRGHCSMSHPVVMMRADAFHKVGGYDPSFPTAQDHELWMRMAEIGALANLNTPLLRYRLHSGSISQSRLSEQMAAAKRACKMAAARRGVPMTYDATEAWRPSRDKASRHAFAIRYGWIAWSNGHTETWWHFVRQSFALKPFSPETWRLMVAGAIRRSA
jgi:glycosyltransferase involved in cell wall biosynthesis